MNNRDLSREIMMVKSKMESENSSITRKISGKPVELKYRNVFEGIGEFARDLGCLIAM